MSFAVAVTGASGFVGRALVERLRADGREVRPLGRSELSAGTEALRRSLEGVDCIVHLAARAHRGGSEADFAPDVDLTRSLAQQAAQAGVRRFVHMSSIGVLGTRSEGAAFTEATLPAPAEPYAVAKLRAEQAMQHELSPGNTEWVILRPPMVYGPHAPGNFARLLRAVQRGWPLPFGSVRNRRSLAGIGNLVDATALCIDHPAAADQVFLLADEDPVSTRELVELMAQGLRVKPRLIASPPAVLGSLTRLAGRGRMADSLLGDLVVDAGHARRALGWRPQLSAREGIVQAAAASRP